MSRKQMLLEFKIGSTDGEPLLHMLVSGVQRSFDNNAMLHEAGDTHKVSYSIKEVDGNIVGRIKLDGNVVVSEECRLLDHSVDHVIEARSRVANRMVLRMFGCGVICPADLRLLLEKKTFNL